MLITPILPTGYRFLGRTLNFKVFHPEQWVLSRFLIRIQTINCLTYFPKAATRRTIITPHSVTLSVTPVIVSQESPERKGKGKKGLLLMATSRQDICTTKRIPTRYFFFILKYSKKTSNGSFFMFIASPTKNWANSNTQAISGWAEPFWGHQGVCWSTHKQAENLDQGKRVGRKSNEAYEPSKRWW